MKAFGGRITWLGHAAVLIESPKGVRVAIDPFTKNNPKFPPGFSWGRLDLLAATHAHFDHFGDDAIELAKSSGGTVLAIFEMALHLSSKGVTRVTGFNKGGRVTASGIEFHMVAADHSAGASPGDRPASYAGEPCGYIMTFEDGFRVYHAGDTNVFADMALIAELDEPDLVLLPIGGYYTMGPREAAKACELLRAARVLPIHWGTFPVLAGTPAALAEEIEKRGLKTEVLDVAPGQSWPR